MAIDRNSTVDIEAPLQEAPCPLGPGDVLAQRYAIELLIGEGTFGWVLAALDLAAAPPRRVALKVLRHRYAAHAEVVNRFERRELEVLKRVEALHTTPHVVRALEPTLLWHGELPYLVLEFIDGPSLREVLDSGPLPLARVRLLGAGIARGLSSIHAAGGVHRDLKPSNLRLRGGSQPVIVDLGITRALWETQEATRPGVVPMTPRYASPEQLAGQEASPASDVYSLGLILYEMLTGEVPSIGQDLRQELAARGGDLAPLPEWVPRCLERDPARRPMALEVAEALAAPPTRSWRSRWGPGAAAALLLALGVAVSSRLPWHSLAPWAGGAPEQGPASGGGPPWSLRLGDAAPQESVALALDARGDLLVAGGFRGSLELGAGPLTSAGASDVYVARLDPAGGVRWSQRFGDAEWQVAVHLASAPKGEVFVTGYFSGSLDFGGQRLFNPADMDIFLARLDAEGRPLWSRRFGDESAQAAYAVGTDARGNAVIMGDFHGTVDFGGGPLVSAGRTDVFLARFDPEGRLLWSQRFGDAREQGPSGLAVHPEGHLVLAGAFEGSIDLGDGPLTSASARDNFVAMFDAEGRLRWSRRLGDTRERLGALVTFDTQGHIVVVDRFYVAPEDGARPPAGQRRDSGFLVTRLTPAGLPLWSRHFGGSGHLFPHALAATPGGGVVITGEQRGEVDLGDGPFSGLGGQDVFVLELGPDGALLDARRFGDAAHQFGNAVVVDPAGSILLAGVFEGTLELGSGALTSAGEEDVFIARLAPRPAPASSPASEGDSCLPPPPGLVAWYPLDEVAPGAGLGSAPGRTRGALRLDGGFLEPGKAEGLDFGEGPFSLSAWIRTTDAQEAKVLLDKRREPPPPGPLRGYCLFLYRGRPALQLADGESAGKCLPNRDAPCTNYLSGQFVADGAWHLVTVTVDRSVPDGGTFYVDGRPVARFDPSLRAGSLDSDAPLRLGSRSSSESGLLHGLLDEVALWNRALTPAEVESLYQAGGAGLCRTAGDARAGSDAGAPLSAQPSEPSRSP